MAELLSDDEIGEAAAAALERDGDTIVREWRCEDFERADRRSSTESPRRPRAPTTIPTSCPQLEQGHA